MRCIDINLIECNLLCFNHETYSFFEQLPYDKYIVSFIFDDNTLTEYGLLEKHWDCTKNMNLTLNGNLLYEYSNDCKIVGYCPIKVND